MPTEIHEPPKDVRIKPDKEIGLSSHLHCSISASEQDDRLNLSSSEATAPGFHRSVKDKNDMTIYSQILDRAESVWKGKVKALEKQNQRLCAVIDELQLHLSPGVAVAIFKSLAKREKDVEEAMAIAQTTAGRGLLLLGNQSVGDIEARRRQKASFPFPSQGSSVLASAMARNNKQKLLHPIDPDMPNSEPIRLPSGLGPERANVGGAHRRPSPLFRVKNEANQEKEEKGENKGTNVDSVFTPLKRSCGEIDSASSKDSVDNPSSLESLKPLPDATNLPSHLLAPKMVALPHHMVPGVSKSIHSSWVGEVRGKRAKISPRIPPSISLFKNRLT